MIADKLDVSIRVSYRGGLSQWGRSNRPRISPGTVKSKSERAMVVVIVSPPTGLCQEN